MKLEWRQEPPKTSGLYWYRGDERSWSGTWSYPEVVDFHADLRCPYAHVHGSDESLTPYDIENGLWGYPELERPEIQDP